MAATDLHVNGPALVQISNDGSTWVNLGYTEDGVDVELMEHNEDIFTDYSGPQTPHDVAYLGETADIRCSFVSWDESTMMTVESRFRSSASKTVGSITESCIGTLYFAGSKYIGVRYLSSARCGLTTEKYRQFLYATVRGAIGLRAGTRITRMQVSFHAIPRSNVLYTLESS